MNTENELKALENDVKGLKTAYPIAASKAKFYVTKSPTLPVSGSREVRFKFTPNYGIGRISYTRLTATCKTNDSNVEYSPQQVNEPQDGSGETVIKIRFEQYSASNTYNIKIIATGTSPGSFVRLA